MPKKVIKALIVTSAVTLLPLAGNWKMVLSAQVWILFAMGFLSSILQPDYHVVSDAAGGGSVDRDRGTELQIIWSVLITQLLVVLEASYLRYPASVRWDVFTTVSLCFMTAGLALRTWAVFTLGRFFTMHLAVHEGHRVVSDGPYRVIRHPSYAGAFLTYTGSAVFMHSWFALIACAALLPFAWIRRIKHEEKMLCDELGDDYRRYCGRTKRVIPGVW